MKKLFLQVLGAITIFQCLMVTASGAPVSMPDTALEAAVEAIIGSDGSPGQVDGEWLVGTGTGYTGPVNGLTELGKTGGAISGVTNLTGLEGATNLTVLSLTDSPVTSLTPIANLSALHTLAIINGGLDNADIATLTAGTVNLQAVYFPNQGSTTTPNAITQVGLAALCTEFTGLSELMLTGNGASYDLSVLSGLPLGTVATVGFGYTLAMGGNTLTGWGVLDEFTSAKVFEFSNSGLDDTALAAVDWAQLSGLKQLVLNTNACTDITPLLDLIGAATGVTIDLDDNELSQESMCTVVPALETAGYTVSTNGSTPCGPALTVTVSGTGTVDHPIGTAVHYPLGTEVTLTAFPTAASGYAFAGWQGDVTSAEARITVTMDADKDLTAVFNNTGTDLISLTVAAAGAGVGTTEPAAGNYVYHDGGSVYLVATPDNSSYFAGWSIAIGAQAPTAASSPVVYFSMPSATTIATATFSTSGHTLTVDKEGNGRIDPLAPGAYRLVDGATIALQAQADTGYAFARWEDASGNLLGVDASIAVQVDADKTVKAIFTPQVTLTMIRGGAGSGTTTPSSTVSPGTAHAYTTNQSVTLIATPDSNSVFTGWDGDLPTGADASATQIDVVMDKDRAITANFEPADYTLTIIADGTGTTSPAPGVYGFRDGQSTAISAVLTEGSGYAFSHWSGDTSGDTAAFEQTLVMDQDRTITANFTNENTLKLTLLNADPTLGSTNPVPGEYFYLAGQSVNITETANSGAFFGGWTERIYNGGSYQDVGVTFVQSNFNEQISSDLELTAHFGNAGYTITILEPEGLGGIYPEPGVYNLSTGTAFILNASLVAPWIFKQWEDGAGNLITTDLTIPVTVNADQTFKAFFELPNYDLTLAKTGLGTGVITPAAGVHQYTAGTEVTLTATPASDSVFTGWSGDLPTGADAMARSLTITMDQNRAITATFVPADYTLTIQLSGTTNPVDIIPAPGQYGYLAGDEVQITALPANGSAAAFDYWSGSVTTSAFTTTVVMDGNKTVFAHYVDDNGSNTYLLTVVTPEGPGTGSTSPLAPGAYRFLRDRAIDLTAIPDSGSYFNGWRFDYAGENRPDPLNVLMTEDRTVGAAFSLTGTVLTVSLTGVGAIRPVAGVYSVANGLAIPFSATRTDMSWVFTYWYDNLGNQISADADYLLTAGTEPGGLFMNAVFAEDTEAPEILACPPDTAIEPDMNCHWTLSDYRGLVTAQDNYGPITIQQSPVPGTLISEDTVVTITVSDDSTGSSDTTCTFTAALADSLGYCRPAPYNPDSDQDLSISLSELMRVVQFYNTADGAYHCLPGGETSEDGFLPGRNEALQSCTPNTADTDQNYTIDLSELLRVIQLFRAGYYYHCGDQSSDSDGVCPGVSSRIRMLHASAAAPEVDLCVDGTKRFFNLVEGDQTVYVNFVPGTDRSFRLLAAGLTCEQQPIVQFLADLSAGQSATYVVAGDVDFFTVPDDPTPPSAGHAKVRILQMTTMYPYVAMEYSDGVQTSALFSDVAYGTASDYVELPAGLYGFTLQDNTTHAALGTTIPATLSDGDIISFVFYGDATSGLKLLSLDN